MIPARRAWSAVVVAVTVAACMGSGAVPPAVPAGSSGLGAAPTGSDGAAAPVTAGQAVTPPPSPGDFACPARPLAGSPPSSRLVGVGVSAEPGFDRVTFRFAPSPDDHPADNAGLIVRAFSVPPGSDANGNPLRLAGDAYVEVRFRDMARTADDGAPAFSGATDLRPSSGAVAEVVRIRDDDQVVDWLIGMHGQCARAWVDDPTTLLVDVQRP